MLIQLETILNLLVLHYVNNDNTNNFILFNTYYNLLCSSKHVYRIFLDECFENLTILMFQIYNQNGYTRWIISRTYYKLMGDNIFYQEFKKIYIKIDQIETQTVVRTTQEAGGYNCEWERISKTYIHKSPYLCKDKCEWYLINPRKNVTIVVDDKQDPWYKCPINITGVDWDGEAFWLTKVPEGYYDGFEYLQICRLWDKYMKLSRYKVGFYNNPFNIYDIYCTHKKLHILENTLDYIEIFEPEYLLCNFKENRNRNTNKPKRLKKPKDSFRKTQRGYNFNL